ncbi:MAG TPA: folylpolyglutamate synthase/dihydrofolate synthase family protein [Acidimicrobiia bacterium]|nr:folylpolyglutamate synthase/dihydrofolate synthase family protein [Acidimicrobiia bacterium]
MDYHAALAYLDAHIGHGVKPGLERIRALLEMMGHPEEGYPIVHIAGTNGKTSTSRMVTAVLAAHGLNAGTFISPHLQRVEERIGVNGRQASEEEFAQAMSDVAAFADIFESQGDNRLTYFELTTAMGFAWFSEMAVDVGIVEVGLGGRLDATNAARGEVAVITGIDFDHTEFLGESLTAIAAEKLAITKEGATLVTGPLPAEAQEIAALVADQQSARHLAYKRDYVLEGASPAVGGWLCQVSGVEGDYDDLFLPLLGRHQVLNMTVAIAACEALLGRALDPDSLRHGLETVTAPGRLEPVASNPLVVIDGAHNPQGFASLARALDESFEPRRWVLLFAAMKDKDIPAMLAELSGKVAAAVVTSSGASRSFPPEDLAAIVGEILVIDTQVDVEPEQALDIARRLAGPEGGVIVAGSLYLVGIVRSILEGSGRPHRNER